MQESCSTVVQGSEQQLVGEEEVGTVQEEEPQAPSGDDSMEIPQVDGTGDEKVDSKTGSVHVVVKDGVVTTTTTSTGNIVPPRIIPKIVPTSDSVTAPKQQQQQLLPRQLSPQQLLLRGKRRSNGGESACDTELGRWAGGALAHSG